MVGAADAVVEFQEELFEVQDLHGGLAERGDDGVEGGALMTGGGGGAGFVREGVEGAAEVFEEAAGGGDEEEREGRGVACVDWMGGEGWRGVGKASWQTYCGTGGRRGRLRGPCGGRR